MGGKVSSQQSFTYKDWKREELDYPRKWKEAMAKTDITSAPGAEVNQRCIGDIKKRINAKDPSQSRYDFPYGMFQVPEFLRRIFGKTYDANRFDEMYGPSLVPIGPYHTDAIKHEFLDEIQTHKWQCVRVLLRRHGNLAHANKQLDLCLQWLLRGDVQEAVHECYPKELHMGPVELASVLLVDACFIIHQLVESECCKNSLRLKPLMRTEVGEQENVDEDRGAINEITQEGVVLDINDGSLPESAVEVGEQENVDEDMGEINEITQEGVVLHISDGSLPESAVELGEQKNVGEDREEINQNAQERVMLNINDHDKDIDPLPEAAVGIDLIKLENQIPFFVLSYIYNMLKTSPDKLELSDLAVIYFRSHLRPKLSKSLFFEEYLLLKPSKNMKFGQPTEILHPLHLYYASLVPHTIKYKVPREKAPRSELGDYLKWKKEKASRRIPTASELKQVGIKIKRKTNASAFFDVSYQKGITYGTLQIPKIEINEYTERLFLNLLTFERLYNDDYKSSYISLYIAFMDCIISKADDVEILVSEGILTTLSPHNEVANLFNKLCKITFYAIQGSYLEYLFEEMNAAVTSFKSEPRNCYLTFKKTFFPSRWAVCSVFGAILLLNLTILQVVYAMLSYYHGH